MTTVVHTRADLVAARAELPAKLGLVPTMGALHAGHAALLDEARGQCESVVATIFVNPTQFAAHEDLGRYPRTLAADVALCERAGVDLVWAPDVEDVYPAGDPVVTIAPGTLGAELEGAVRPTHFAGVLTVVGKLFGLVRPDRAYFGEKDYQQLTLIRRMVLDLELGVEVVGVPTVRERDGLALSSRNVYLSAAERTLALSLSRALRAGRDAAEDGRDAAGVLDVATAVLGQAPEIDVDYLALRGVDLGPAPNAGDARLLVAARVGATRLIDNVAVVL
jgi:pantoate--beta-alanine ligase